MPGDQDIRLDVEAQVESGPQFQEFDYGQRVSFTAPGTPYVGSRYVPPESEIYYPPPPRNSSSVDPATLELNSRGRYVGSAFGGYRELDPNIDYGPGLTREEAMASVQADYTAARRPFMGAAPAMEAGPGMWGRFREGLTGSGAAFNFGFAAMALGQESAAYSQHMNAGGYVSPEQQTIAQASFLPGVGQFAGTVLGAFGGPTGALAGSFIGGAIGSGAQALVTGNEERGQAAREAAETLNTASAGAAGGIRQLADAIQALHAPTQQVRDVINSIAGAGPITANASALPGLGAMVTALGANAGADFASTTAQLRDPALFPLSEQYRANLGLDPAGYAGLGATSIVGNDPATLIQRERDIQAATVAQNPAYQQASDIANAHSPVPVYHSPLTTLFDFIGRNLLHRHAQGRMEDIRRETAPNPLLAQLDAYAHDYGAANYSAVLDESSVGLAGGGVELDTLRGGSVSALGAARGGLYGALDTATADEGRRADVLRRMIADPAFAGARTDIQRALNASLAQTQGFGVERARQERAQFEYEYGAETAGYQLGNLRDTFSGVSNADQAAGAYAQADYLERTARTGPLSDIERSRMQGAALQLRYGTQQGVFAENLDIINTGLSGASATVAQAQATGTPGQIFAAQGQEIQQLTARLQELTQELRAGGQSPADYRRERQQLDQTQAQIATETAQQRIGYFSDIESMNASGQTAARAGLSRDVLISGNAAFGRLAGADSATINTLQADLLNEPPGTMRSRQLQAQLQQALAGQASDSQSAQTFMPGVRQRESDESARFNYQMSRLSPYTGGPESNPATAAAGLIGQDQRDLAAARAFDRTVTDPLAREQNHHYERGIQLEIAGLQRDVFTNAAEMLPERLIGGRGLSPGVGSALFAPAAVTALMSPGPQNGSWLGVNAGPLPSGNFGAGMARDASGGVGAVVAAIDRLRETFERRDAVRTPNAPLDTTNSAARQIRSGYNPNTRRDYGD